MHCNALYWFQTYHKHTVCIVMTLFLLLEARRMSPYQNRVQKKSSYGMRRNAYPFLARFASLPPSPPLSVSVPADADATVGSGRWRGHDIQKGCVKNGSRVCTKGALEVYREGRSGVY